MIRSTSSRQRCRSDGSSDCTCTHAPRSQISGSLSLPGGQVRAEIRAWTATLEGVPPPPPGPGHELLARSSSGPFAAGALVGAQAPRCSCLPALREAWSLWHIELDACALTQLASCCYVPLGRLAAQRLLDVLVAQSSIRARLAAESARGTSTAERLIARGGTPRPRSAATEDRCRLSGCRGRQLLGRLMGHTFSR
jgi:hypothetical protein